MSLTLRGIKGSALTHGELDNNFLLLKGRDIVDANLDGTNLVLTKDDATTFNVDLSINSNHYLGEPYLGGVIFNLYKGSDGLEHGHVVSLTESATTWSTVSNFEGADSSWDGISNTNNMVLATSPAKQYVQSLGPDWYIGAIDEINILFNSKYYVNKALSAIPGADILKESNYWSSYEYKVAYTPSPIFDPTQAWAYYMDLGFAANYNKGNPYNLVRGIKAF